MLHRQSSYILAFYASDISEISKDDHNSINVISYYAGFILNAACFLYAFIIYLFAFKEKKILRAIEAIVCLYLYYGYINNLILNTIIYIMGGDYEKYSEFLDQYKIRSKNVRMEKKNFRKQIVPK